LRTLRLDFDRPAEATLALTFHDGRNPPPSPVGLDGVYRMSPTPSRELGGFPVGMRGEWQDEATFSLDYDAVAGRNAVLLHARFQGDRVLIDARERTHQATMHFEGAAIR
jgi:hypothetical protein